MPHDDPRGDILIDGRNSDVYAPTSAKVDTIRQELKQKMKVEGRDVVLALDDNPVVRVEEVVSAVRRHGYSGKIWVTSGADNFVQVYP